MRLKPLRRLHTIKRRRNSPNDPVEKTFSMEHIIGITCGTTVDGEKYYLPTPYVRAIEKAGGTPLLVPPLELKDNFTRILNAIDGLLLAGGKDPDPILYGEEPTGVRRIDPGRDFSELQITKLALRKDIPILGICRGCQVLNVATGGTLNQHIQGLKHWQSAPVEYPTHEIEIKKGTILFNLLKSKKLRVNTFHHQSVRALGTGFIASAKAKDGVIEGIESKNHKFVVGVQFHIEHLWESIPLFKELFVEFVKNT